MTLRTFYAYDHEKPPEPETETPERDTDDPHNIAWGYNLADLDRLARMSVHRCFVKGGSAHDRYQAAWSAIAEALVIAEEAPDQTDLIYAGWNAIRDHTATEIRQHGKSRTTLEQHPGFDRYWQTRPTGSPESGIVERMALWEIIPKLSPRQWEAIKALTATEDYALAAGSMGLSNRSFNTQIQQARKRFLQWWHEGETPSKLWRRDKRVYSRDGTFAGKDRLTVSQVESVRDRYTAGEATLTAMAAEYGVSGPTLSALVRGRHKPAPDPVETP